MLKALLAGSIICCYAFPENYSTANPRTSRGTMAMSAHFTDATATNAPLKKITTRDSIKLAYHEAMESKRIETLDAYLFHYGARHYRQYQEILKLGRIKTALRLLRADSAAQAAVNRAYPCFGEGADTMVTITIRGLSTLSQKALTGAWYNLRNEVAQLPSIRLPASLDIDYTCQPPVFMLAAVVSPIYDIGQSGDNAHRAYRISCLLPAMRLLQRLKLLSAVMLHEQRTSNKKNDGVIDYEVKKVRTATYAVRLTKPDSSGAIIFYARENRGEAIDTNHLVQFNGYYDLSTIRRANRHFPLKQELLPEMVPSMASDSVEQFMLADFFRTTRPKPAARRK